MKTAISRFHIHDELTAPDGSAPILRGALATGGQLPNFLGGLAGSPAALRGYQRLPPPLRRGAPPRASAPSCVAVTSRSPRSSGSRSPSPSTTTLRPASRCTSGRRGT